MTTQRPVVGGLGTTLPELQAEMFRVLTSQRKSAMRIRWRIEPCDSGAKWSAVFSSSRSSEP